MKLKIVYFGTPDFSAYLLEKILKDKDLPIEIKLVVSQPDKPVGRRQVLTPSPVKQVAEKFGVQFFSKQCQQNFRGSPLSEQASSEGDQPLAGWRRRERSRVRQLADRGTGADLPRKFSLADVIKSNKIDLGLLYAFGEIIPKNLLDAPEHGFWNIHPSLLPQYRGASPIAYPLMLGDKVSGVTLIKMDEKLDHGPILAQEEYPIEEKIRKPDLRLKLTDLAFEMLKNLIKKWEVGSGKFVRLPLRGQNHKKATYARLLKRDDGFISLSPLKKALKNEPLVIEELPRVIKEYLANYPKLIGNLPVRQAGWRLGIGNSPKIIFDYFRGLYPWPGVWTYIQIKNKKVRLKLTDVDLIADKLIIKKVQLEGKKEVDFSQFNRAYRVFFKENNASCS